MRNVRRAGTDEIGQGAGITALFDKVVETVRHGRSRDRLLLFGIYFIFWFSFYLPLEEEEKKIQYKIIVSMEDISSLLYARFYVCI